MEKQLNIIRQIVGWNQKELAELVGVSTQTLNNIENGRSKLTPTMYVAIIGLLNVEVIKRPAIDKIITEILELDEKEKELELGKGVAFLGAGIAAVALGGVVAGPIVGGGGLAS